MEFLRGENQEGYIVRDYLALDPEIQATASFSLSTFILKIINNDIRVKATLTDVEVNDIKVVFNEAKIEFSISKFIKVGEPFKLVVIIKDMDSAQSLLEPTIEGFPELNKSHSFIEDFEFNEDGSASKFIGAGSKIVLLDEETLGSFGPNFLANTGKSLNYIESYATTFGENCFENSDEGSFIIHSKKPLVFKRSSFRNSQYNFILSNKEKTNISELDDFCFSSTKIKSFIFSTDGIIFGEECFSECSDLRYFKIYGSPNNQKHFFSNGMFKNCINLYRISGNNGFDFDGKIPRECFMNCKNLQSFFDNKETRYGRTEGIIELGNVEENGLAGCKYLSENNVFGLFSNSSIYENAFAGFETSVFIYNMDESTDSDIRAKFHLPENSSLFRFYESYSFRKNKGMCFFWHQTNKNFIYHEILRFFGNGTEFSFKKWLNRAPYCILPFSFADKGMKKIFIPTGCKYIKEKAFFKNNELTIFLEDSAPGKDWDEDWNLLNFDIDGNKIFIPVVYNSRDNIENNINYQKETNEDLGNTIKLLSAEFKIKIAENIDGGTSLII